MGATLIAPFEVEPQEDERFLEAWHRSHEALTGGRGFIGTRLCRRDGDRFRFVEISGWSSPLMVQRAMRRPGAEPPPFPDHGALYVVAVSASAG